MLKASEFVAKCKKAATDYKTLYVMGCFGAPMNPQNKARWKKEQSYNRRPDRARHIDLADSNTFGFDCVCFIKAILWGWCGDASKEYGGVKYQSNGVPDEDEGTMFNKCTDKSYDFRNIKPGEAVWMPGHIGVYIGDGLAVECTPAWNNCVQITAVGNIGEKTGYFTRTWKRHGKLPYVDYTAEKKTVEEIAAVVADQLCAEGYNPIEVAKVILDMNKKPEPSAPAKPQKSIDEIAREVIRGKWGNGSERKQKLTAAGYSYAAVQKRVNELMKG